MIIDNVKFARQGQNVSRELDIAGFSRLQEILKCSGKIKFDLTGSVDYANRPTLTLKVCGIITTLCHGCMQPVDTTISNATIITLFFNEEALDNALFFDEESNVEDGELANEEFNVLDLVEDELIMCLPLAPKHETCNGISYSDNIASPFDKLKQII